MPDPRDPYDTLLSPQEEAEFRKWAAEESRMRGRDVMRDTYDYDLRGYWKSGDWRNYPRGEGHAPDTYKKPNHPTFSEESIYHGSTDPTTGRTAVGGRWLPNGFVPSARQVKMFGPENLREYFREVEPGFKLYRPGAGRVPLVPVSLPQSKKRR